MSETRSHVSLHFLERRPRAGSQGSLAGGNAAPPLTRAGPGWHPGAVRRAGAAAWPRCHCARECPMLVAHASGG